MCRRDIREPAARGLPGTRCPRTERRDPRQYPTNRVGKLDPAYHSAWLEGVIGIGVHHPRAQHREDVALGPVPTYVGDDIEVPRAGTFDEHRQPDRDQRRQIGAGQLRRRFNGAILGWQPGEVRAVARRIAPTLNGRIRCDGQGLVVGTDGGVQFIALRQYIADVRQRRVIRGIQRRGASIVLQRGVAHALTALDRRQLAVEKRAVWRTRNRVAIGADRIVWSSALRRGTRGIHFALHDAQTQHLDASRDLGQRGIQADCCAIRRDRLDIALTVRQRLPLPHPGGDMFRRQRQRAFEAGRRLARIALGEFDPASQRLGGMKPWIAAQRRRHFTFSGAEIAVLQEAPSPALMKRRFASSQIRGNDRLDERGIAR